MIMTTKTSAIALATLLLAATLPACAAKNGIKAGTAPRTTAGQKLVLHLDDVRVPSTESAVFKVYVNGKYVDELYLAPPRSQASAANPETSQNFTLPIPDGMLKAGEAVSVKLTPDSGQKLNVKVKRAYVRAH
jgi:hypothetical protein